MCTCSSPWGNQRVVKHVFDLLAIIFLFVFRSGPRPESYVGQGAPNFRICVGMHYTCGIKHEAKNMERVLGALAGKRIVGGLFWVHGWVFKLDELAKFEVKALPIKCIQKRNS